MSSRQDDNMTRRSALTALTSAGLGLAVIGLPGFARKTTNDHLNELLPNFSEKSRALLQSLLLNPNYSGQIPAADVATLVRNESASVEKLMVNLIPLAQGYSQAPISNFHVGVVVRGATGSLYTGANIEIPGQCLGFAVHAEQSALSNAYMHAEQYVAALAVGGAPCGHCRQFINEMSPNGEVVILIPEKPPAKLSEILPAAFGPAALGMKNGALPVPHTALSLSDAGGANPLVLAALDAAQRSYSPYSQSPSGLAILGTKGRIHQGSYIENVAFNPSLSPLQTALAAMIAAGEPYSAISQVALVESRAAKISQKNVTETVMAAIAPTVKLQVANAVR
jgi:cytidine deaminase